MQYYSTNGKAPIVNFETATINGQAPDQGLYFPEYIPVFPEEILTNIDAYTNEELAYLIIKPFVGDCIPTDTLKEIVAATINFPLPLLPVSDKIFSLELYHGPTLAFKDIGARFMSRCLSYFVAREKRKITVLVATSGDTGGAVANGFYDVPNVNVIILYPSGKVSSVQEKQLTTLGKNIHALEVDGNFDDCQQLVKRAFADTDLEKKLFLTSANSINVARWLPQQFYYFFAFKQWPEKSKPPVISVPSGNFGNICAGILARASGLPVRHFIAACNANDTVPLYFDTNDFIPKKAVATISNAMDVGNPSNFVRILEIFSKKIDDLKLLVSAVSVNDMYTAETIKRVLAEKNYLLDPHGAVAYFALNNYLKSHPEDKGIVVETAHPVKFYDVVEPIIGKPVPIPPEIQLQLSLPKSSILLENNYATFKEFLITLA